jgi:hypothetical protein
MNNIEHTIAPASQGFQCCRSDRSKSNDANDTAEYIELLEFTTQEVILYVEVEVQGCMCEHEPRDDTAQKLMVDVERFVRSSCEYLYR